MTNIPVRSRRRVFLGLRVLLDLPGHQEILERQIQLVKVEGITGRFEEVCDTELFVRREKTHFHSDGLQCRDRIET